MTEIWKDIEGHEGYQVSNMGRVKSLERIITIGGKECLFKEHFKKPNVTPRGYLRVNLCYGGKYKTILIHRLVAKAFPEICGEWFDGCECDHLNTDRTDNRAENIRVVSKKTNMNNPITKKKLSQARKNSPSTRIGTHKIQLDIDGRLIKVWDSAKDAAGTIGCSRQVINDCCADRCKTAFGFIWKNYSKETYLIALMNKNIKKKAS